MEGNAGTSGPAAPSSTDPAATNTGGAQRDTTLTLLFTELAESPTSLAVGRRSVWVAAQPQKNGEDATVSRIDPSSGSERLIPVARGPHGIAVAGGRAWVAVGT